MRIKQLAELPCKGEAGKPVLPDAVLFCTVAGVTSENSLPPSCRYRHPGVQLEGEHRPRCLFYPQGDLARMKINSGVAPTLQITINKPFGVLFFF
ncbi:MAG: hypothetical protein ACP5DZ_09015 [Bacteroidales bacterium]